MTEVINSFASLDERKASQPVIHWQPSPRRMDGYNLTAIAWGEPQVRHLLSRAAFGATVAEVKTLAAPGKSQLIDQLIADEPLPAPPGTWVTEPFDPIAYRNLTQAQQQEWQRNNRLRIEETRAWWLAQMGAKPLNLREKMVYFWHNHFTSEYDKTQLAQWVFKQHDMIRRQALGNFRDFLKAVYKDPAMLIYLDSVRSIARQPNENFARELLELFTMGVGNYTENDIKQAARAFTGWVIDSITLTSSLNQTRHDNGIKTFFGKSGNFGGDEIVDIILEKPVVAEFICTKLYKFFVSREVDKTFVTQLADIFRANNYAIKPVLRAIFESDHFYSAQATASLIKSPIELAVSSLRMLNARRLTGTAAYLLRASTSLDQDLLNPPSVAGWPGQRDWINATTLVTRNVFSETYIKGGTFDGRNNNRAQLEVDAMALARSFGVNKAPELVDHLTAHLLRYPIDEATRDFLITVLIGTANVDDWSLDYPGADTQVKDCLTQIIKLPEFQLM